MEEVRRVPTTKKEKKKSTTILIILAVFLGIALIATAVYFYTLGETEDTTTAITETTCACYFIDPAVVSECGDPRRGFLFELTTVSSDQTCSAPCSTQNLSINLLNSSTQQELYKVCPLQVVQDARCNEMTIKDSSGKIITGRIGGDEEITIEAKFDNAYSDHKLIINNTEMEPDSTSTDQLTITKTYTDSTATTLNIFATATDSSGNLINSPICRRLIEVDRESVSDVSEMQIQTRRDGDVYKISRIRLAVGNVAEDSDLSLKFSFNNDLTDLLMNEGFTIDSSKGEISILQQELYNPENFETQTNFSQLDGLDGNFEIVAEIRTETELIGEVEGSFTFPKIGSEVEPDGEAQEAEASSFEVSKISNINCVERVSPNNVVQFTLTATNNALSAQSILTVKDKLPLGFTYVNNSTKINGTTVTDSEYITVTDVGDTKEIVWNKEGGWTINAGQPLTIVFQSNAGENALTGENQNEVVITPEEIPEDPTTLRAELVINVAQNCQEDTEPVVDPDREEDEEQEETPVVDPDTTTTPDTGIFDSVIARILLGILVITTGWYLYSKPIGQTIVEKLVDSGMYKEAEMATWKVFKPKKYFETIIVKKLSKKKKN